MDEAMIVLQMAAPWRTAKRPLQHRRPACAEPVVRQGGVTAASSARGAELM
jgi:hypothetical protein